MLYFIIILGLFFTVFSGSVLAYISIATMLGPWIAPTIAVMANLLLTYFYPVKIAREQATTLIQSIGSVGGAIATAIGFAFPMLFFLDPKSFAQLLDNPYFFCFLIAAICLISGAFGITLGICYAPFFIGKKTEKEPLPFPISHMTYSIISAQSNRKQAIGIFSGATLGGVFAIIRDNIGKFVGFMPKMLHECVIILWPTLLAIGFMSGPQLIAPLFIGLISKYLILFPLNNYIFMPINATSFTVAFCSGIVASEITNIKLRTFIGLFKWLAIRKATFLRLFNKISLIMIIPVVTSSLCLLTWLKFPIIAQIVLLVATGLATYQICIIGGNIGLIQYGRFSTYVLVPMFLLFNLSALQLTIVCTFFNICAATASDLLFDIKTGDLANISRKKMILMQWIGLVGTALTIGIIFYLLFTGMHLGSPNFFAQRSQSKALLLQTLNFDFLIVLIGFAYGLIVKKFGFNPTMVFGGIIMPYSISIGLILGASLTLLTKQKADYLPFCAGVFTSESLLVLAKIFTKFL